MVLGLLQTNMSRALFTDLYELTMAQAYWQSGVTAPATFSLYFRSYPPDRAYFVLAGIHDALRHIERFRVSADDLEYLRSTAVFDGVFLDYLGGLRFTGEVRAMDEGTIFFAGEPVLEVTAPIIEAQILETYLLNEVNLQTILATKASRVVHAAGGKQVVDFAARRTHGIDAANRFARVSYIAGFAGTSNVVAGKLYGIPTFGTMAHSFVEAFGTEEDAFRRYAESFPDASTFLVDTYDTLSGVKKGIEVALEMKRHGHALRAVRLDSGNLLDLSIKSRALLDEARLPEVQVFASGGLDEFAVDELLAAGAPIDGFGVGTKVGVSADAPWTDSVYKLVEYDGRPTLKLSSKKHTHPGRKQIYRYRDADGTYVRDLVCLVNEKPPDGDAEPLLRQVMSNGGKTVEDAPLGDIRESFAAEFAYLPDEYRVLRSPSRYPVAVSDDLEALTQTASDEVSRREGLS